VLPGGPKKMMARLMISMTPNSSVTGGRRDLKKRSEIQP
jgi:hypothetical protein